MIDFIKKASALELLNELSNQPHFDVVIDCGLQRRLICEHRYGDWRVAAGFLPMLGTLAGLVAMDRGLGVPVSMIFGAITAYIWLPATPWSKWNKEEDRIQHRMLIALQSWVEQSGHSGKPGYSPGELMAALELREDLWSLVRSRFRYEADVKAQINPNHVDRYNNSIGWFGKIPADHVPDLADFERRLAEAQAKFST